VSLLLVRVALPAAIALAGVVLLVIGGDAATGAGVVLIGVAAIVVLANLFIRLALRSERDREREEERRHGE
jgi:Flp pilus assembly protein TadB